MITVAILDYIESTVIIEKLEQFDLDSEVEDYLSEKYGLDNIAYMVNKTITLKQK
jgi:hypothetical protein